MVTTNFSVLIDRQKRLLYYSISIMTQYIAISLRYLYEFSPKSKGGNMLPSKGYLTQYQKSVYHMLMLEGRYLLPLAL